MTGIAYYFPQYPSSKNDGEKLEGTKQFTLGQIFLQNQSLDTGEFLMTASQMNYIDMFSSFYKSPMPIAGMEFSPNEAIRELYHEIKKSRLANKLSQL